MTAPGLADCAGIHAPVCAGNNGDFEIPMEDEPEEPGEEDMAEE